QTRTFSGRSRAASGRACITGVPAPGLPKMTNLVLRSASPCFSASPLWSTTAKSINHFDAITSSSRETVSSTPRGLGLLTITGSHDDSRFCPLSRRRYFPGHGRRPQAADGAVHRAVPSDPGVEREAGEGLRSRVQGGHREEEGRRATPEGRDRAALGVPDAARGAGHLRRSGRVVGTPWPR